MTCNKTLDELIHFNPDADLLWQKEYKIPWNDPDFSRRMLKEHLSQEHDLASRRREQIDRHVHWIHHRVLAGRPSRILDLGCGPGLYVSRLASLGHQCTGIDFSPASIDYARRQSEGQSSSRFILDDILTCEYGGGYDLAMILFGEINVFPARDCRIILDKIARSLVPGGCVVIEAHTLGIVKKMGTAPSSWFKAPEGGLFSDAPHMGLVENRWYEPEKVARSDFWIFETESENCRHCTSTTQAYTDEEYKDILIRSGFQNITFYGDYGQAGDTSDVHQVIVGKKLDRDQAIPGSE